MSTRTIRALIADDEPLARERVRTLLGSEPDVEVVGEAKDGLETVDAIMATTPDLVFLDVQMPKLDGFEVIDTVGPERMPSVVFVTAFDQHALRAFEVQALDYLLKPFDQERFQSALKRIRRQMDSQETGDLGRRLLALVKDLKSDQRPSRSDRLVVKSGGRLFFLRADEIDWVEAAGNYVRLHVGAESHLHRQTLADLNARIDPSRFVRIHRCAVVNLDRVVELRGARSGHYEVLLRGGARLSMSRRYRRQVLARSARA
jgi:two-component system LytT family response regulator